MPPVGAARRTLNRQRTTTGSTLITDGLVSRYTFEGTSDTTTLVDTEGSNDGSITGMSYVADNSVQGSYVGSFDGNDDYASVPDANGLDMDGSSFSITYFAKFQSVSEYKLLVSKRGTPTNFVGWSAALESDDTLRFIVNDGGDNVVQTPSAVTLGAFIPVAAVYDDAAGELRLYIDGTEEDLLSASIGNASNTIEMELGRWQATNNRYFPGDLDDVRIYNRALTANEASDIANGNG